MGNLSTVYDYEVLEADEPDQDDYVKAMQESINAGVAWKFQGSVGRAMMEAIEAGYCLLGRNPAADYYGNRIPSRDEVKAGTKGSFDYVAEKSGLEYAKYMAAL